MNIVKNNPSKAVRKDVAVNSSDSVYSEAMSYIQSSMNSLNARAKQGDKVAKEAIVNMGVVLFDLAAGPE